MSGTITTGSIPRLLQQGVKSIFGNAYDEHEEQYGMIFNLMNSSKAFEVDAQLEGYGLAQVKEEGGEIVFDTTRQGFTPKYPMIEYAKGIIITQNAIKDEQYDQFGPKAQALAFSMRQTKEVVAANVLNNGFNSAFQMTDGDGSPLFATNHVNGPVGGGTFSNKLAIDADLSEASLEDILIQINQATDPRGKRIALIAEKLIVSPSDMFNAQRILGSVLQNDTANNATNAMRDMNAIRNGYAVNNYLTDPDAWFVKTNCPNGMKFYQRDEVSFEDDNVFSSGNMQMKAQERYSFGWSDPRGMYGSQGA